MTFNLNDERLPASFWRHIQPSSSGCWTWTSTLNHAGYGRWSIAAFGLPRRGWRVHRLTCTAFVGPIGEGMTIDHLCRVRNCCFPGHLEEVTQGVNTLRGNTLNAENLLKTHCPQGHPYDAANTYVCPKGRRNCRICTAEARRRWERANPEKVRANRLRCEERRKQRRQELRRAA